MNNKKLKLKIVTPERLILEELVDQVTLPTTQGEITVLPNHIPLIASLASGDVVATVGGEQVPMAVVGGFIEVKSRRPKGSGIHDLRLQSGSGQDYITEVAILADFAEHVGELSDERIKEAKRRAEEIRKKIENKEIVDFEHFEAELERSLTRVKIADKWKSKKYRK